MAPDLLVDIEKRFASGFVVRARLRAPMPLGSILVLFGPSGSGKTTIIRCIAGLETPETGLVQYGGETWFAAVPRTFVPPQRRRIGYVFQDAALFPHLTARANVEYGAGTDPPGGAVRSSELIDLLDLGAIADRYPRQLSGGQSQRVALARALAPHPRLLLLDEPFAALDTPARSALRRLLRATVTRLGIAAVLVTHDRNEAIAIGDGIAVIIEGRVRQMGPVVDVFRRPADLTVARSVGVDSVLPASIESAAEGLLELRVEGARLRAADVGLEADTRDVFACIRAEDVTIERATPVGASARNHLAGTIESIESDGPLERVTIDCGFPLTALITRHARDEMALRPGSPVVAAIKATAIHLVPRV